MIIRIKYWSNWLLNLPFVLINSKQCLKSDSIARFPPIFAQKTLPGPHMNMQIGFVKFFVSAKIFYIKVRNSQAHAPFSNVQKLANR